MSINIVHDFQSMLYSNLAQAEQLCNSIDKIYVTINQDAKYPFVLIDILNVARTIKFNQNIYYHLEFKICVFLRNKNYSPSIHLADLIIKALHIKHCRIKGYIIIGMQPNAVGFERSHDLVTTKLIINYKALLTEEVE